MYRSLAAPVNFSLNIALFIQFIVSIRPSLRHGHLAFWFGLSSEVRFSHEIEERFNYLIRLFFHVFYVDIFSNKKILPEKMNT